MIFKALSIQELEQVRLWRNEFMASLRTPYMLTEEMQQDFYVNVICNRLSPNRYWGIWEQGRSPVFGEEGQPEDVFVGLTGIQNIQWENRIGEIALIIDPSAYGNGYGTNAVLMLLDQGFNYLNLENIFGECYQCSPAVSFWTSFCSRFGVELVILPKRKFYGGQFHDSLYFNFNRQEHKP